MRNFLKYKGSIEVKHHDRKSQYLKKQSLEYNSIVDIHDDGLVKTIDGQLGKIYQYTFRVPCGLSIQIDNENKKLLTQLISSSHGKIKIYLLNEQRAMLNDNMEFIKERIQSIGENDPLSDVLMNRYMIMQSLEKIVYSTGYIFVDDSNYKFEELASRVLNIYQLKDDKLLNFIERLNNDVIGDGVKKDV